ncbi:autotransporter domain-containing protein [Sphingomonas cavernae]|nr:autotransporter domain-containing protein [Sphingomonas cavernae]
MFTSALVAATGFPFGGAVQAADYGLHLTQNELVSVEYPETETVEGDRIGIFAEAATLTLDNEGTIRGNGGYDGFAGPIEGGITAAGGPLTVTNSGEISGAGHGISTAYFYNSATGQLLGRAIGNSITNTSTGTIRGESNDGVRLIGGGTVTNSGDIIGTGAAGADGISMFAYQGPAATGANSVAQDLTGITSIGTVDNLAGGTISGQRFGIISSNGGTVHNAGEISGGVAGISVRSFVPGMVGEVTNGGTVAGGTGVIFGDAVGVGSLASASLDNDGDITGSASYGIVNHMDSLLTVTNGADGTITGALSGIMSEFGTIEVTNAGDIRGGGTADSIAALPDAGIVIGQPGSRVVNTGMISGANAGITTTAAYNRTTGATVGVARNTIVENSGTIIGDSNDGVRLIGGGTVTNSGTIEGRVDGARADGVSTNAFTGQDISGPDPIGTVINRTGGTISGARGGVFHLAGGVVENAGAITGGAVGVQIQNTNPTLVEAKVANSGTITGPDGVVVLRNISSSTVTNSGTITGTAGNGVYQGGSGAMTLTNAATGTITGTTSAVLADLGAIHIDNAGKIRGTGSYDGFAALPDGGVTLVTGQSTITNSGEISGAGHGISTAYFNNAATSQLEGRALNTQITNTGTGTIRGESNDGIRLIGGGTVTNSGAIIGTGGPLADGISMFAYQGPAATGANSVAQDLTGITSIGTVNNLAGGTIKGDRYGIISSNGGTVNNVGEISGLTGGVRIQSPVAGLIGTVDNGGTITGGHGVIFSQALASGSLRNSGTIAGTTGRGVFNDMAAPLTVENRAGGTITGVTSGILSELGVLTITNAGTIRGDGTADSPTALPDAGVVIGQPGSRVVNSGLISGANTGITTTAAYNPATNAIAGVARNTVVENSGTIRGDNNDAVRLFGGGSVINSGTIQGVAGATTDGITIQAFSGQDTSGQTAIGTVTNQASGVISGARYGVLIASGGVVDNAGTITGTLNGLVIGKQNTAGKTAALTNSGTINGGVHLDVDSATATNSGTIRSGTGVAFSSLGAVTLTNSGALTGGAGTAATLSGFDDSLILKTGSVITGAVDGGAGVDSVTLDGTSAAATAAQSLTQMDGFEKLSVDRGYWNTAGAVGAFDQVTIGANATLRLNEVAAPAGAASPIATTSVVNNGLLVFNFADGSALDDADALVISGSGGVRLEGEAIITVDTGALAYTGLTDIANGGLILTGSLGSDVVTSGDGIFQLGDGGTTGSFTGDLVNNGSFVFNRSDDYDFLGDFSGTGDFAKMGAGTLTFAGGYSYTGVTRILGGTVRLAGQIDPETEIDLGAGTFDISGTSQTIASLSGTSQSDVVIDDSTLTVDQDSNTEYAGEITGDGSLVLTGDGRLNLTGNSTYTGPTTVEGGTLSVNGSIVSTVTVDDGGTLGGNGTVGGVVAVSNGTVAPGNSIGRLQVAGNVSFAAGSVYEVEVEASGAADRIDATGTATLSGGTVEVLAANGQYRGRTDYTILTAAQGVNGRFGTVTSNLAFLTPSLGYSANAVTLTLLRNDIDFAAVAATSNQTSTANAVEALGVGNTLFEAVLVQNATGARTAYDALSGEIHASVASGLINDSRHVRDALLANGGGEGVSIWGQGLASWGQADAQNGTAKVSTDQRGLIAGVNWGGNGFSVGLAGGIGNADYRADARSSDADADSSFVGGQAGYTAGRFSIRAGAAFGWHDIKTTRSVIFPGFNETAAASYDATSRQFFGEIAHAFDTGPVAIAPFARFAHVRTHTEGFTEAGGASALTVEDDARKVDFLSLGLKLDGAVELGGGARFLPRLTAAWQHGWGDLEGRAGLRFAASTNVFTVVGAQLPRNAVMIDGGFAVEFGAFSIGAAYVGSAAEHWADHGGKLSFGWRF